MNSSICERCSQPFTPHPRREDQRFCSQRCRKREYHSRRDKESPAERVERLSQAMTSEEGVCLGCSGPLPIPRQRRQACCCRKCTYKVCNRNRNTNPFISRANTLMKRFKRWLSSGEISYGRPSRFTSYAAIPKLELQLKLTKTSPDQHYDHIIPMRCFNLSSEKHLAVCFHHLNLRVCTKLENAQKSDNVIPSLIPPELMRLAVESGVSVV